MEEVKQASTREDKFKVSRSKLGNLEQQKQRISEYKDLKVMKERLKRTEAITDEVNAALEWEDNKAVMQNLKERVEGANASHGVKNESSALLDVEEKVRSRIDETPQKSY